MSTLAVKVVLDTRRALLKNAGSKDPIYPIKLRVTFARKQRYGFLPFLTWRNSALKRFSSLAALLAVGCSVPQRRNFALLFALLMAESLGPASEFGIMDADATATARGRSTFILCAPLRADPVPSYPWFLREKKRIHAM